MLLTEIIPAVRALARDDKFRLAHLLLEDLAQEEPPALFQQGHFYPIYTPEFAPNAATQLAQLLAEDTTQS